MVSWFVFLLPRSRMLSQPQVLLSIVLTSPNEANPFVMSRRGDDILEFTHVKIQTSIILRPILLIEIGRVLEYESDFDS